MNGLKRFFARGMEDADRRVAAMLSPPPLDRADDYLKQSALLTKIDRLTARCRAWWLASTTGQRAAMIRETFERMPPGERSHAVGLIALTAVTVHVILTMANGVRPGWFLMIVPAMAALFAALSLAAGRHHRS